MSGVRQACVSLAEGVARVRVLRDVITPQDVSDAIYDLGFDVTILTVNGQSYSGIRFTIITNVLCTFSLYHKCFNC